MPVRVATHGGMAFLVVNTAERGQMLARVEVKLRGVRVPNSRPVASVQEMADWHCSGCESDTLGAKSHS